MIHKQFKNDKKGFGKFGPLAEGRGVSTLACHQALEQMKPVNIPSHQPYVQMFFERCDKQKISPDNKANMAGGKHPRQQTGNITANQKTAIIEIKLPCCSINQVNGTMLMLGRSEETRGAEMTIKHQVPLALTQFHTPPFLRNRLGGKNCSGNTSHLQVLVLQYQGTVDATEQSIQHCA